MWRSKRKETSGHDLRHVIREELRQVYDGGRLRHTMYFAIVAWLTSIPSFNNSPWRRGAPVFLR